jgi:capsular polysaccharide export protein
MNASLDNDNPLTPPWMPPAGARLAIASLVKRRFPMLGSALQAAHLVPLELSLTRLDGVLGWGERLPARMAREYAGARGLKYWSLEDGFLRSVGLGKARHQALSIVVDDLGMHHDPRKPSRLEQLILAGSTPADIAYARQVRTRLIEERLTKYNYESDHHHRLPRNMKGKRILLVDQVSGDASIAPYGLAAFNRMWLDALDQDAEILIRDHPDVLAGFSAGILRKIASSSNTPVLDGTGDIDDVLAEVEEVWTVSSQFGFEALMRGKPVVTYGTPFYSGWGLTDDRARDTASLQARQRRAARTADIDELVAAALIRFPIYFDPVADKRVGIEKAIDRLCSWRRHMNRFKGAYLCVGFSRHKHPAASLFLHSPRSDVAFANNARPAGGRAPLDLQHVFWGRSDRSDSIESRLIMEDGFIRSVGLGSELVRPRSLCLDPIGIYYDATRPSQLEAILNETDFDEALLHRAQRLRRLIAYSNISKYNLSDQRFDVASLNPSRPVALVAEQMADDASLRYGQPVHTSSLALLAAVRKARPDHFILFKRHPDIVSGTRRSGGSSALDYCEYADYILDRKVDIAWTGIDECHSATSQLGFEALLRGVTTYCHGAPFYSGWGLTVDDVQIERRRRMLSIDQLVAGALILYPSYRCWRSKLPCEPEDVIRDIINEKESSVSDRTNRARGCR